jgi:hypothetical protein
LDLDRSVGQRQATWRFDLVNGVTGMLLGQLHPIIDPAVISHDTTRTIKRQLSVSFGVADSAAIDPIQDRLLVSMVIDGASWPQGRYMFTAETSALSTGGTRVAGTLLDEMFLVDQQISTGFPAEASITVQQAVIELVSGLPLVDVVVAQSPYQAVGSWAPGTTRGQILAALATQGDYQTPWIDSDGAFRMIRMVDAVSAEPTLDFDRGNRVIRDSPAVTSDLTTAPNRFIVVGNGGGSQVSPVVGTYDVPPSAPHSIQNRGFVVPDVRNIQVADAAQATAAARSIGLSRTVVTTQQIATAPDPRHDSYDVIRWQSQNWLETGWSMTLQEGVPMSHTLRRGFV